jgi:hypothetical protein
MEDFKVGRNLIHQVQKEGEQRLRVQCWRGRETVNGGFLQGSLAGCEVIRANDTASVLYFGLRASRLRQRQV